MLRLLPIDGMLLKGEGWREGIGEQTGPTAHPHQILCVASYIQPPRDIR
jgi:hypothetical protein